MKSAPLNSVDDVEVYLAKPLGVNLPVFAAIRWTLPLANPWTWCGRAPLPRLCNNIFMWINLEGRFEELIAINDRTIEFMEALADTRLKLVGKDEWSTGETVVTGLTPEEVITRMVTARRALVHGFPEVREHKEDLANWVRPGS
jgi:uncharacterized protein YlzI (FlbEa/FlbD family)